MRAFNDATQAWEYTQRYENDGQAWVEVLNETEDDAATLTSAFNEDTYMGQGTVLQRDVSDMPLDPRNAEFQQFMWEETAFSPNGAYGAKTSLNTSAWGTQPIYMYVVDSTHPECTFKTFAGSNAASGTPTWVPRDYLDGQIPLPSWAVPAQNGDRGMAVYDRGTGIMREYFMVVDGSAEGSWKGTGGYSIARRGLDHLAEDNYALQQQWGISNVAGMHNSLGFIGIAEALNKKINHALCFTAAALRMRTDDGASLISWPSRASDGKLENYGPGGQKYDPENPHHYHDGLPYTPTHGQWGRLPESVDPEHNPRTGKPYNLLTQVIIDAAKRYGLVATDTNLWCHAFNAEQGRTFKHVYGEDPWASGGIIDRTYRDKYGNGGGLNVADFPWDLVDWAPVDWGRPVPDMNLRPGQIVPWLG